MLCVAMRTCYLYCSFFKKKKSKKEKERRELLVVTKFCMYGEKSTDSNVLSIHTVNNMSLRERIFIINELVQFALLLDFD